MWGRSTLFELMAKPPDPKAALSRFLSLELFVFGSSKLKLNAVLPLADIAKRMMLLIWC